MITKNPQFGGISPCELIALRDTVGLKKILKFAEAAKELSGKTWPNQ